MNKPIGIFDSGIGGISFLDNLVQRFKYENFIYLADNKNCPYGNKSKKDMMRELLDEFDDGLLSAYEIAKMKNRIWAHKIKVNVKIE